MIATLTYHSIDDSGSPVSVSPAAFAGHVRWLAGSRVSARSLDDLATGAAAAPAVAVTFDDGFANVKGPVEMLLDHGIVPTIFVVTHCVGGTNAWGGRDAPGIPTLPLLGWKDLEHLTLRGAKVEAHSRTHPRLTAISAVQRDDEIGGSREDLASRLGVQSAHFAYPYGDVDESVATAAGRHFKFAHTTEMRPILSGALPLLMPRLDAYYFRTPAGLAGFGLPAFERRLQLIRARRRLKAMLFR